MWLKINNKKKLVVFTYIPLQYSTYFDYTRNKVLNLHSIMIMSFNKTESWYKIYTYILNIINNNHVRTNSTSILSVLLLLLNALCGKVQWIIRTTKTGYHRSVNALFATATNRKIRLNWNIKYYFINVIIKVYNLCPW